MKLLVGQLYLIVCTLFLAGKDADSYQLKDKTDGPLTAGRVKRWHGDGVALYCLYLLSLQPWDPGEWWKLLIGGVLIRLSFFDLAFNHWAPLPVTALGGTAVADQFFVHIFGIHGALAKSATFFILLVAGNMLNHFLQS